MTAYTGTIQPAPFQEDVLRCSATIIDNTVVSPVEIGALESVTPLAAGVRGDNLPVSMHPRGLTGREVPSFLDDYYYRFHVVESAFNYGAILYEITQEFILWNAFFVAKDCSQIVEVEGDEFDLSGLTAPFTLNGLAYTTYTFTIPIEGAADFDASITFDFSPTAEPSVTISGARPVISPGRFTFPVGERLIFNTEILQSHNRTEQRIAKRRGVAEQHISTKLFIETNNEIARFEANLHLGLKRAWPVPLWPQAERHGGLLPAGSGSIAVDTRYADFRADSQILIWQSKDKYEFCGCSAVGDALLTLSEVTINDYDAGQWIVPCRIGRVIEAGKLERYHGGALCAMAWRIEDVEAVTGFAAAMSYDGYTVLTDPAALPGEAGDFSHDPDIAVLESGNGPFEIVSNSDFNEVAQSHGWRPTTKADCWWLRQLLYDKKGRQKAFLVPTFKNDLEITRLINPAETALYVANAGLTANMGVNALRTYLAFRPAGASIIVRKVMDIALVSDAEELITLNTGPGLTFNPGDTLCWVDRCRLASDEIELTWSGVGQCEAETPLVRVRG